MEVSGVLVDFGVVVVVVVVAVAVVVNDEYFLSKSCCFIEPKRTNTGVFDFVIVVGTVGTFRSIDKRGLVVADESVANARKGPLGRVGFVVTMSIDDGGLFIELVVELIDARRLVSWIDVCLRRFLFCLLKIRDFNFYLCSGLYGSEDSFVLVVLNTSFSSRLRSSFSSKLIHQIN